MERDLNDFLRAAADADERSLTGVNPGSALERATRGVRRRRRARHARVAVLSVAGFAAVGAAAVLGGSSLTRPVDPATDGVVATADPAPTGPVTRTPGIPPYRELTEDVLTRADAGWVVSVHLAETHDELGLSDPGGDVVLVTTPRGDSYRVPGVPQGVQLEVVDWRAGETTAVVREHVDGHAHRAVLDLTDGTVTPDERGLPDDALFVGRSVAGEVWQSEGFVVLADDGTSRKVYDGPSDGLGQIDPSGRLILGSRDVVESGDLTSFEVVDLTTGDVTGPFSLTVDGRECGLVSWLTTTNVLARCLEPGTQWTDGFTEVDLDVSGSALGYRDVRTVGHDDPFLTSGAWVSDGVLIGDTRTHDENRCASDGASLRQPDGTLELVQATEPGVTRATSSKAARGVVYVQAERGCNGEQAPSTLTAHDLVTGVGTELLGYPVDDRGDRPGMLSWVPATP